MLINLIEYFYIHDTSTTSRAHTFIKNSYSYINLQKNLKLVLTLGLTLGLDVWAQIFFSIQMINKNQDLRLIKI